MNNKLGATMPTKTAIKTAIKEIVKNTPTRSKPSQLELAINAECDSGHSDRDIIATVIHLLTLYRHHNPNS
jgi:hypothetical protein